MCRTHRAEPQGCHTPAVYDRHKEKAKLASLLAEAQVPEPLDRPSAEPPASWLAELDEWLASHGYASP